MEEEDHKLNTEKLDEDYEVPSEGDLHNMPTNKPQTNLITKAPDFTEDPDKEKKNIEGDTSTNKKYETEEQPRKQSMNSDKNNRMVQNKVHPQERNNMLNTQANNNPSGIDPNLQAMILPDPKGHDNAGFVCYNHCCGIICLTAYLPCNLCCANWNDQSSPMVRIFDGQIGLSLSLGRFESYMLPGIYMVNRCVYDIKIVSMLSTVYDKLVFKFLTNDNVEITLVGYITVRIIDPYTAVLKVKDRVSAIKGLCGGAIKSIITTSSSQEILSNSSTLDEKIMKRFGGNASIFG